ncbi:hypothetical protein L3X38_023290 [Prunus dulcis]|uniref:Uncharacterized protein n=1 Tax=Prunus dulcis TaxID=3755 RepID=A0AAD4Z543_PRUDU|nr:hypothetical protein L3X38_023290 [Prunus dulcis]
MLNQVNLTAFMNIRGLHLRVAINHTGHETTVSNQRFMLHWRSQGNSFEGPIPTSFSQLTSLESLRSSDIYYVSSSLDFIRNLKNFTDLVLRNTLINGSIPTDFGEYQCLQILDLGFNN